MAGGSGTVVTWAYEALVGVLQLIAEAVVSIEMGATAKDLAMSVHPHPTLSETWMECAEAFYGHATHVMGKKK